MIRESAGPVIQAGPSAAQRTPVVEVRGLHKSFGNTRALNGVSLRAGQAEVVGLIGENGAGKSTLLNIVSGNIRPDAGSVLLRGQEVTMRSPRDANLRGVFHIHQELALVPNLPVYENLFLSHEDRFTSLGVIRTKEMRRRASTFLARLGHEWIDPTMPISSFDFSARQVIEIAKALALADLLEVDVPVLLLDEPTARLTHDEVAFFKELLRELRRSASVFLVSHHLAELIELSDRIYVLRDGELTAEVASGVSERELHRAMVGRERPELFYQEHKQREAGETAILEVRGFTRPGAFRDVDLTVHDGEIVGIAGLVGCGKEILARAIFGSEPDAYGEVHVAGEHVKRLTVGAMMKAEVGYVSPDRREEGIMADLSVAWNMSIAALSHGAYDKGVIDRKAEEQETCRQIEGLGIKTPGPRTAARTLSGGNQQKILMGRWMFGGRQKVLILHNPTHGVDAGVKGDIYELLRSLVAQDTGILLVSDDLPEVIGLSNRVLVMNHGSIVTEVATPSGNKPDEVELVAHMV
jgi:ribose transport system ATP-binding protein